MPRKNKKKGRTKTAVKDVKQTKTSRSSAPAGSAQGSPNQAPTSVVTPNFDAFQQPGKVHRVNYRTVYSRYKAATKRVFDYLQEFAQKAKKNSLEQDDPMVMQVDSLVAAADWMMKTKIPVDPDILKDLKFSIRMRSKVARFVYGGGDSGHQYMLDTLVYCWKVLDSLPSIEKKKNAREKDIKEEDGLVTNPYEALQDAAELEWEEDLADEDIFPSRDVPRPTLDSQSIPLQKLLDAEDRMDACLFLFALDNLMRGVVHEFSHVPKVVDMNFQARKCMKRSTIVPSIITATIATNLAIQQVQRLEIEFELQNPHINTPLKLLSTVLFPIQVQEVIKATREHGKKICTAKDANLFVGDCLECSFRPHGHRDNRKSEIISNFCSRCKIDSKKGSNAIEEVYRTIRILTIAEVPLEHEVKMTKDLERLPDHAWLHAKNFKYIGGDRSIHHTIRLLLFFAYFAKKMPHGLNAKILGDLGGLGDHFRLSPWQSGRSTKIRYDLDELLMVEILPDWLFMCRDWILNDSTELPRQGELAPLWSCLRRFVRSTDNLRWSTVFAVHAILTATLETDNVTNEVELACQTAFESYFRQLDVACEHKKGVKGSIDSSHFKLGMTVYEQLKQLGNPEFFGPRALWNPLCAGTFLLYLNYQGNIAFGTRLIDDRAQLKIVMHFYHALLVNDILQPEDIPFLDGLYRGFEKSKVLWGGSLPRKGKLVEQFWSSIGGIFQFCGEYMTKVCLDDTLASNQDHLHMIKIILSDGTEAQAVGLFGEIKPEEISTSYRRVYNRDYHDVVDKYHPKEMRRKETDGYMFAVQVNDTVDAFLDENELFAYNLPACGIYLDEFVCGMSRFFNWDKIFRQALQGQKTQVKDPERMAEEYLFARNVLGKLDSTKRTSELDGLRDFVTCFMRPFFEKLSKNREQTIWFEASVGRECSFSCMDMKSKKIGSTSDHETNGGQTAKGSLSYVWRIGDKVVVCGLKKATRFNGKTGTVISEPKGSNTRYGVLVNGRKLAVLPSNLE